MTTPCRRAFVSIVATLTITLALGGCIRTPSRTALDGLTAPVADPHTIRFDNLGRERVHVYLIGAKREWLLGRVEPGAIASLRIPDAALAEGSTMVQLAVLAGERATFQAARHARATLTISQPASALLSQRWTFSQGQLTSLGH
jgi:hypothetical protein